MSCGIKRQNGSVEPRRDGLGVNCHREIKQGKNRHVFTGFGEQALMTCRKAASVDLGEMYSANVGNSIFTVVEGRDRM